MNKEEQRIWFRGDQEALIGLNGIEQNNRLDDIEAKFWKWYNRSQYELSCEVILHFITIKGGYGLCTSVGRSEGTGLWEVLFRKRYR